MKKIRMLFLSLLMIVMATGCGKEQKLVCTTTETEEGMSIEEVISMTYKDDKLKHMKMEVNTKITDPTMTENWEKYKEFMNEDNKEFNKDGISFKIDINDESYEYNTSLDIDIEKASEEALKEQGFDDLKADKSTLQASKAAAEEDGATCEIK